MSHTAVDPSTGVSPILVPVRSSDEEVGRGSEWWRSSVIYQVYPRSFRDADGDGNGDLRGITAGLASIASLDVDAVWLSPFYPSPQRDGGYDVSDFRDVDPMFGTLDDFDALVSRADELGVRVIVDIVPNHCSSEHPLFRAALAAAPGSPERELFLFRDGTGPDGELPPNNWISHFGGPAWTRTTDPDGTPGQWYLHLFDSSQPDFDWSSPLVHAEFERTLRFWLDRGVAGFRVDVAHALVKHPELPDWHGRPDGVGTVDFPGHEAPMFGQPALHDIYRRWNAILAEYGDDRVLCAEASVDPIERLTNWVLPDQMQQAFNFAFLGADWTAEALPAIIETSLRGFDAVGAPTTWVLSNHDNVRHATRFGYRDSEGPTGIRRGDGIGASDDRPDAERGLALARAAAMVMLALPGGVYLYQGEELGLPDHTSLPDSARQDPTFVRTAGARLGRDGCRIPLPWTTSTATAGFNDTGESWLPQPEGWAALARSEQEHDPHSTLSLYRAALALRRSRGLGSGSFAWLEGLRGDGVLAFVNRDVLVVVNLGTETVDLPAGEVLLDSVDVGSAAGPRSTLTPEQCVWLRFDPSPAG
ncbi:glycoside hydrolase family 13 protein [Rathayibacter caricis]|uniref:glycoside hydrolase family 13 protein n=1 Tax=Rathayibacter caricis TaxID=110936 RepID=UPI001FB2C3A2|nr:glycoside hydrolase family 13 protein [Rathayibacter caricis]MCJ1697994.1 glycoside hydrolase family 13 protein [Rathayibacter caricis]